VSEELTIEYIDVYAPGGNGPINQWVDAILSGNQPKVDSEIYHWVHIRDAESAHRTLSAHGVLGHFLLCGRRAWTQEMVTDEIRRLWTRFQNSIEHSHTIDSLSETPSPAAVQYSGERRRPNLAPLHDALVGCGTDGWRPMTAMRVGLMECIAHSFEQI
jgi:hypothetical protein|tara:strand:+ start:48 stop:524 length:477 start_codon:yes stop_codon:yes gene_type:complete